MLKVVKKVRFGQKDVQVVKAIRENIGGTVLLLVLVAGIISGVMSARLATGESVNSLDFIFSTNFSLRIAETLVERFVSALSSYFIFLLLLLLLGFSLWGFVLVPIIPMIRGFGIGLSVGYLCVVNGLSGAVYSMLVLLPGMLVSSLAIVSMARRSIDLSLSLYEAHFPLKLLIPYKKISIKGYLIKSGIVFVLIVVSAMVDVVFVQLFASFFHLNNFT